MSTYGFDDDKNKVNVVSMDDFSACFKSNSIDASRMLAIWGIANTGDTINAGAYKDFSLDLRLLAERHNFNTAGNFFYSITAEGDVVRDNKILVVHRGTSIQGNATKPTHLNYRIYNEGSVAYTVSTRYFIVGSKNG